MAGLLLSHGVAWRHLFLFTAGFAVPLVLVLLTTAMPSGHHERADPVTTGEPAVMARGSLIPFIALAASIGLYVAAEVGTSNWLVRFLADQPIATATGALSIFWGGLAVGRLLSNRIADRFDYFSFTIGCIVLSSLSLAAALMVSWLPLVVALFGLAGLFSGPVFPMIVAVGGNIYPKRLSALSGGLTASAVAGGLIYPPFVGLMAGVIGIRGGLFGAALLGIPQVLGIAVARKTAYRASVLAPT
jgi:fucose permease